MRGGKWAAGDVGWDQRRFAAPAHQNSIPTSGGGPALEASLSHPTLAWTGKRDADPTRHPWWAGEKITRWNDDSPAGLVTPSSRGHWQSHPAGCRDDSAGQSVYTRRPLTCGLSADPDSWASAPLLLFLFFGAGDVSPLVLRPESALCSVKKGSRPKHRGLTPPRSGRNDMTSLEQRSNPLCVLIY